LDGENMEIGHVVFEGIKCIYTRDWKTICITPAESSRRIPIEAANKKNYIITLNYGPFLYQAFIIKCSIGFNYEFILTAKYLIKSPRIYTLLNTKVREIEFIGNEIDAIFDPVLYFYNKHIEDSLTLSEAVLYHSETAQAYDCDFNGKKLKISVRYGEMLSEGLSSDRILHARLIVRFLEAEELLLAFDIYKLVLLFVQMMSYHQDCRFKSIRLLGESSTGSCLEIGYLFVEEYEFVKLEPLRNTNLHPYFGRIFNLLASDVSYHVEHLPARRTYFRKFSTLDVLTIFAAFESECEKEKGKYLIKPNEYKYINEEVSSFIETLEDKYRADDIRQHIEAIKKNVVNIGNEYGERQKIRKAYSSCKEFMASPCIIDPKDTDISKVINGLVRIRNRAIHHNEFPFLNETENDYVAWFHILYLGMFLRRAEIPDEIIELTLDDLFFCNGKMGKFSPTLPPVDPTPTSADV